MERIFKECVSARQNDIAGVVNAEEKLSKCIIGRHSHTVGIYASAFALQHFLYSNADASARKIISRCCMYKNSSFHT